MDFNRYPGEWIIATIGQSSRASIGHSSHVIIGSLTNSTSEIRERSAGKGIGHFIGAIEINGFIDKDEFKKQIDEWIRVFRNTKPGPRR